MENIVRDISILSPLHASIGESPVWDKKSGICYWVDIEGKIVYEFNWQTKRLQQYKFENRPSLVIPGNNGNLLIAFQGGVASFNKASGKLSWLTHLNADWSNMRCNDGAVDSLGRLWVGTMELNCKEGEGTVFCIKKNGIFTKKIEHVSISNGMAFSADNKRLYYTDSLKRNVVCYQYDANSGAIEFEKIAVDVPARLGLPDGIAMDAEGMLWVALWGGFGVSRWNVDTGVMADFIPIPVPQVSSCAFAGEALGHLVITTATKGMTEDELIKYPDSGHVFIVQPGVKGLPRFYASV